MEINYTEKLHTQLCVCPGIQTIVGVASALRNTARLITSIGLMILWRMGPESFNHDCDERKKWYRELIRDPLTIQTDEDYEKILRTNDFFRKGIVEIEGLKVYPSRYAYDILKGIISAIPVVGTIYNGYRLKYHTFWS